MDENSINAKNTDEEIKEPVFSSNALMTRDFYHDLSSVSYHRMKKILFVFLCFTLLGIIANIQVGNYDTVASSLLISLLMLILYFRVSKVTKLNYERNLISAGKEATVHYELYEDKIILGSDEYKREYSYDQITKFFDTKNFLLLHLKLNLYFTINKATLNANTDEVKSFLIQKCPFVKKKRFVNCAQVRKKRTIEKRGLLW